MVPIPVGEYSRNRLQLKQVSIPTILPVSTTTTVSTNSSTTVQPASIPLYTKDAVTKPKCPIKELPNNNKGNSNVLAQGVPGPQV